VLWSDEIGKDNPFRGNFYGVCSKLPDKQKSNYKSVWEMGKKNRKTGRQNFGLGLRSVMDLEIVIFVVQWSLALRLATVWNCFPAVGLDVAAAVSGTVTMTTVSSKNVTITLSRITFSAHEEHATRCRYVVSAVFSTPTGNLAVLAILTVFILTFSRRVFAYTTLNIVVMMMMMMMWEGHI